MSSRVEDWFAAFLERHIARHPRADWPDSEAASEFYRGFRGNLVLHGLTEEVADLASERLMAQPPEYLDRHVGAILEAARSIFRERAQSGQGHATDSRDAALLASLACPDCEGQGLATRWRRRSAGGVDAKGNPLGPTITLYCTCPMGRWLEHAHRSKSPDVRKRLHDLAEHPWLQVGPVAWSDRPDNEYRYAPESWDDYARRPIPETRREFRLAGLTRPALPPPPSQPEPAPY